MMGQLSIYVPDDLQEEMKAIDIKNVSAVCQHAIREQLEHQARLAELSKDMKRIEVRTEQGRVAFTGTLLATHDPGGRYEPFAVYLTSKQTIVVSGDGYRGERPTFETYSMFQDFTEEWGVDNPGMVAEVAHELGIDYVTELDI